jgi:hypothetical protein
MSHRLRQIIIVNTLDRVVEIAVEPWAGSFDLDKGENLTIQFNSDDPGEREPPIEIHFIKSYVEVDIIAEGVRMVHRGMEQVVGIPPERRAD